jgi:hypothetical protein
MADSNALTLPLEIEGITRDWLEGALSGYAPGVRVRGVETVDMIRTTCTKIRLKLDLETTARTRRSRKRSSSRAGSSPIAGR